jgi:hypothetical protein
MKSMAARRVRTIMMCMRTSRAIPMGTRSAAASVARPPWPALLAALLLAAMALVATGCATTSPARRADARLAIACNVPDARVYVDDVFVGRAADLSRHALAVASGSRRVELRADGWFTAYRDVAVPPAGRADLRVDLRPVPPNEPAE